MPPKKQKDLGFRPWQKTNEYSSDRGHFITIHHTLIDTQLYWSMQSKSRDIYQIMLRKFNGHNDKSFTFPYPVAKAVMSEPTFYSCIKELIENGFVEYVEHHKNTRQENIYKFSDKWRTIVTKKMQW